MAPIRQSMPDYGLGFQVKAFETLGVVPSSPVLALRAEGFAPGAERERWREGGRKREREIERESTTG